MFCWDLKDGYWHVDLHSDFWTYMVFEWEGKLYHWSVMPFGMAPAACWVFTIIISALIAHCRLHGLKCLAYIDGGLGAESQGESSQNVPYGSEGFHRFWFYSERTQVPVRPRSRERVHRLLGQLLAAMGERERGLPITYCQEAGCTD